MAQATATQCGIYLYGVIRADEGDPVPGLNGIDDAAVYPVTEGALAAVVSDVPYGEKIRPQRHHLAAHQTVLKNLMQTSAVLPMSFGIIADDEKKVHDILSWNQEDLRDQLQRVTGNVEMSLRVHWDVPNIFEYFVNTHAQLSALRDALFQNGHEPTQTDKLQLERLFEGILNTERAVHTEAVWHVLLSHCVEIKEDDLREGRDIMNLACLVRRDACKEFEAAVVEVAKLFTAAFCIDFSGPWPPYNFADIKLSI